MQKGQNLGLTSALPMKTHRFAALTATLGIAALIASGCAKKEQVVQVQPAPVVPATPIPTARIVVAPPQPIAVAASDSWMAIKDMTFEQRADFVAGIGRLEGQLDGQINILKSKRAAMTTDTKDWDFAMGGLTDASSYLHSMVTEVSNATPDTWNQEKDKVDQAWQRAQEAYDKVRTSTTN